MGLGGRGFAVFDGGMWNEGLWLVTSGLEKARIVDTLEVIRINHQGMTVAKPHTHNVSNTVAIDPDING